MTQNMEQMYQKFIRIQLKGQRVAIVDDLLATGGTIEAVTRLVEEAGGEVVALDFAIELTELKGREN